MCVCVCGCACACACVCVGECMNVRMCKACRDVEIVSQVACLIDSSSDTK